MTQSITMLFDFMEGLINLLFLIEFTIAQYTVSFGSLIFATFVIFMAIGIFIRSARV